MPGGRNSGAVYNMYKVNALYFSQLAALAVAKSISMIYVGRALESSCSRGPFCARQVQEMKAKGGLSRDPFPT